MQTIEKESPSPKACRCCSPKATFVSLILVGVIVLVASFVVSAVILTKLQDGMINSARINSPNTNAKAYNDWLTNVPERRSSGDAAYRYFSYYLFNITNIDEVVAASMTPGAAKVIPVVNEVGPYTYRKFQDKLDPTFDANEDKVRWQEYGRYIFQPDYSKMGGSQLSDTSDYFYQPSTIYTAIFGNPLASPFYQRAEWDFRLAVAAAAPFIYTNLLHTLSGNILLNNSITGASAVQVLRASAYNSSLTALGWTKARDSFARIGAGLYPSNPTKWAGSPPLEYWDFLQQGGYPASYAFSNTNQALAMTQKPSMTTNLAKVRGFNCTDMRLTTTGSAACWIYYNVTAINQYLTFLTPNQITGIKAWVQSLAQTHTSWVFDVMGHQASRYASYFSGPSSCQPDPLVSTNFTNCFMFNNANLYVRTTPWSLLWEDKHLLGPLVFAGRTVNRPTKISYFTNHTSEQDARVDSDITQLGTGINHIADLDNLYVIKNYSTISTLSPSSVWCHRSNDPDYAPDGKYFVQSFVAKGYQFNQVTQEGSTKQNPAFPPGKVADMNRYSLDLSVLGSRSFKIDLWVSELSRHFKAVWARDITFKGIDLRRYTIADSEFAIIPFYGQYHQGLANYTCGSGVMSFSCLPRYGKVDTAELALSTMDLATITTPTPEDFIANAPFGTNFFDPSDLLPYIDMEPISGASMAGSLKMQLNVQVDHWLGAPKSVLNSLTSLGLASNFQQTAPRNRPTLIPTLWLNKIGFLSDKQADTFKTTVYGTQTASKVVLVAGTIVGGVMAVIGLALMVRFVRNTKSRAGFATQPSSDDLTATGGTVAI